jgi:hypothetical protein
MTQHADALKEGTLLKLGGAGFSKSFKPRYFVLLSDTLLVRYSDRCFSQVKVPLYLYS